MSFFYSWNNARIRAGLPEFRIHDLRHSFASHLVNAGRSLYEVQELLGHANISTTQVYTRLDFQHLAKAYDAAHPRAKRTADSLGMTAKPTLVDPEKKK